MSKLAHATALAIVVIVTPAVVYAQPAPSAAPSSIDQMFDPGKPNIPEELFNVGVDEKLDSEIPKDATFKDETGKMVRFGDYVDQKRPMLVIFAYHTCPVLCSLVQNAVLESIKETKWSVGQEYTVLTVSIDSRDTVERAADKRSAMVAAYGRGGADAGWHFLVGDDQNIHRVTDAAGWKYRFDSRQGQYAHPSAVVLLKPNGRVARYLYGIDFPSNDMRLGLLEASEGKSISTIDRILLYCYHYDPQERKYTLLATRVMQLGGIVTLIILGSILGPFWLRQSRKAKNDKNEKLKEAPKAA